MSGNYDYIRDPAEIYRQSFATVEREADLGRFPDTMHQIATRLVHACGMVDVLDDLVFSPSAMEVGAEALRRGGAIFSDVEMVRTGIISQRLPAENEVICTLNDARVRDHAQAIGNTRSAAGVDLWDSRLDGAVAVIGNAPTALFRLLERVAEGSARPALIIGIPVGFVGAVESKQALKENVLGLEFITVLGRRGGSAMAAAVVNGLCGEAS